MTARCGCELTSGRTEAREAAALASESWGLLSQTTESGCTVLIRQSAEGGAAGGRRKAGNVGGKIKDS